jgi:hypothetical protein
MLLKIEKKEFYSHYFSLKKLKTKKDYKNNPLIISYPAPN